MRFGLSTLSYAGVLVAGALMSSGEFSGAMYSLVAVTVALFIVSLRNTWDLLVGLAPATLSGDAKEPERQP